LALQALQESSFGSSTYHLRDFANPTIFKQILRFQCLAFWPIIQVADALAAAYESLYTNPKWLTAWSNMWGVVAAFFKDRPEILGIELINEPFAGDLYRDPLIMVPVRVPNAHVPSAGNRTRTLLSPLHGLNFFLRLLPLDPILLPLLQGVADYQKLQPAYEIVQRAIRQADPTRLVFFAGVTWSNFGAGFTQAPGGAAHADHSVRAHACMHRKMRAAASSECTRRAQSCEFVRNTLTRSPDVLLGIAIEPSRSLRGTITSRRSLPALGITISTFTSRTHSASARA
jgi:hypothetical protein